MIKQIILNHFCLRIIQLNCFNSPWRKWYPSLPKIFVCGTEIGLKKFDKFHTLASCCFGGFSE